MCLKGNKSSSNTVSDVASKARSDHLLQVLFRAGRSFHPSFQPQTTPPLHPRPLLLLLNNELTLMASIMATIPLISMLFPFAAVSSCYWKMSVPKLLRFLCWYEFCYLLLCILYIVTDRYNY